MIGTIETIGTNEEGDKIFICRKKNMIFYIWMAFTSSKNNPSLS